MEVKVLRAFLVKGEALKVGAKVDLPDALARELIHVGKAEAVSAAKPAKGPMKSAGSPLVAGGETPQQEKLP